MTCKLPMIDPNAFNICTEIFRKLYPTRQPDLNLEQVDHSLSVIPTDPKDVNIVAPASANIISQCLKNVFTDGKITLGDFPIILKTINDVAKNVNGIKLANVTPAAVIDVLEVIICVVFQMVLPGREYDIARTILVPAFSLLRTNVSTKKSLKMLLSCKQ